MLLALIISVCVAVYGAFLVAQLMHFAYFMALKTYHKYLKQQHAFWITKIHSSTEEANLRAKESYKRD